MDDLDKFKAWDDYVEDKPILKSMIGEQTQSIMLLKKNQDAMHERQEKMWGDITDILTHMNKKGIMD